MEINTANSLCSPVSVLDSEQTTMPNVPETETE